MSWFYTKGEVFGAKTQIVQNFSGEYEAVYYRDNELTELTRSDVFSIDVDDIVVQINFGPDLRGFQNI